MLLTTCPETRCPQKGARVTFLFSTRPFAWQEECAAQEPALCPSWLLFFQLLNVTGSSEISPTALQASHSPGGFAPLEKEQRGALSDPYIIHFLTISSWRGTASATGRAERAAAPLLPRGAAARQPVL